MPYIPVDITTDVDTLYANAIERYQVYYPDWEPDEASVLSILFSISAYMAYEQAWAVTQEFDNIYVDFGEELYGIVPLDPTPATGATTWVAADTDGHTIPVGEQVVIDGVGFAVDNTVTIPPGSTTTAVGEVPIIALQTGVDGNGLGENAEAVSALEGWVEEIIVVGTTAGGSDGETNEDYRDRLSDELTTVSPTAVTASDFVKFARRVPGAYRAMVLDAYDPAGTNVLDPVTNTYGNPGHITVSTVDENGLAGPEAEVLADLEGRRMTGIQLHYVEPTYTPIDVTATITVYTDQYSATDVAGAVEAAINNYLSPATWGAPPYSSDTRDWKRDLYVRRDELFTVINNVTGVEHVDTLSIDGNTTGNVALTGDIPLPEPGTITVTVA